MTCPVCYLIFISNGKNIVLSFCIPKKQEVLLFSKTYPGILNSLTYLINVVYESTETLKPQQLYSKEMLMYFSESNIFPFRPSRNVFLPKEHLQSGVSTDSSSLSIFSSVICDVDFWPGVAGGKSIKRADSGWGKAVNLPWGRKRRRKKTLAAQQGD